MQVPELAGFDLVGGTALSLLYGHRLSIDLDLFSPTPFENEVVAKGLKKEFGDAFVWEDAHTKFGIFCFVEEVKVDIVRNPHPLVGPRQVVDGIRMFSVQDILAMKIQAILGRGQKKDFWDIAELLRHYTIADFVDSHLKKYPTQQLLISIPQAMTYFSDADETAAPVSLKHQNWEEIKSFISKKVSGYLK